VLRAGFLARRNVQPLGVEIHRTPTTTVNPFEKSSPSALAPLFVVAAWWWICAPIRLLLIGIG